MSADAIKTTQEEWDHYRKLCFPGELTPIQEDELRLKKLEFAHAISPLENPMSIRSLRKDIARLKTVLKQKQAV